MGPSRFMLFPALPKDFALVDEEDILLEAATTVRVGTMCDLVSSVHRLYKSLGTHICILPLSSTPTSSRGLSRTARKSTTAIPCIACPAMHVWVEAKRCNGGSEVIEGDHNTSGLGASCV